ncbi:hypothetical protein PMSD_08330 [Paenibacillus macquariensis subsp. defensor]|nr:hypothetical protein PMSD_08330 [Paenibacillus macquariensis subsp. defensor]
MKPIEFILEGNGMKSETQYPHQLQGVSSFQVSSETNKKLVDLDDNENKEYKLVIKQDGNIENLILKLVREEDNIR